MIRWFAVLGITMVAVSPSAYAQEQASVAEQFRTGPLAAFVTKYCGGCHAGEKAKAQLRLEPLPLAREAGAWVKVRQHVVSGTMPPENRPQPVAEERRAIVAGLKTLLADCGENRDAAIARTVMRRLNRTQYRNTIRDLFGIDFDPTERMPADEVSNGFDNLGAAQRMSPTLMRHYLRMAQEVAARVVVTDPATIAPVVAELEWRTDGSKKPMKVPLKYFGPRLVQPLAFPVEVPAEDDYLLEVQLIPENLRGQPLSLVIEIEGQAVGRIGSQDQDLTWHRQQVHLAAGKHTLTLRMAPNPNQPRGGPEQVLRVEHLKLTRPNAVTAAHYPAAHRRVVRAVPGEGRSAQEAARLVLEPLARQAFRRPVNAAQVDGLLRVFEAAQADGASYEAALRHVLEALLCSPRFLFIAEADADQSPDDHALASRLSYFLWGSLPDEPLLLDAAAGQLRPKLAEHIDRMIADPKFERFAESFVAQWLGLAALANFQPDAGKPEFAGFDDALRQAMLRETTLFFASVFRDNLSLTALIDADHTFVDRKLADLYDLRFDRAQFDRLKPGEMLRVSRPVLPAQRGGLLTQGAVLASTSYPTRTSPVLRGAWVLDRLLGAPPPPPPPDVPALDKAVPPGRFLTVREQLELHRQNQACAICHNRIDPLGFALENYNAIGRYRSEELGPPKDKGQGPTRVKVDATGKLPTGEILAGVPGLKKVLLEARRDDFVRCLTGKLLTYALARDVETHDPCVIEEVLAPLEKDDLRSRTLLHAIIRHRAFQGGR